MAVTTDEVLRRNKAAVRRMFEEFLVKGNRKVLAELCAPTYKFWPVVYTAPENRDEHAEDNRVTLRTIFPDLHAAIVSQVAEGEWVATRHVLYGTHLADMPTPLGTFAPTGKRVTWTSMSFHKFDENGKIVEGWLSYNPMGILQQIGQISGWPGDPGARMRQEAAMQTLTPYKLLEQDGGAWNSTFSKYLAGPSAAPVITYGHESNRFLEGGLWMVMDQRYDYPGGAFEGVGLFGYDPEKERYVGAWVDSTNSHLNVSEGDYDSEAKTLTLIADGVDPTSGELTPVKQVISHPAADEKVFSVFRAGKDGSDMRLLEVAAKRRAPGEPPQKVENIDEGEVWKRLAQSQGSDATRLHAWEPDPTPQHEPLHRAEGEWDATVERYLPDGKVARSTGVERHRLLHGGLWLASEYTNEHGGQLHQGFLISGYDRHQGKYVGAAVESSNPHRVVFEGTYDDASGELTFVAEGIEPSTGRVTQEKQVIKYPDSDTRVLTLYRAGESGKDEKVLQVTAKRRK